MSKPIDRRTALAGLGSTSLFLGASSMFQPAFAQSAADRPQLTQTRDLGKSCDNVGVPVSSVAKRISTVQDFGTSNSCSLTPEAVEGPYFICVGGNKGKDLTGGLPGQPLTVALRVRDQFCTPIPGAIVDIWSCDAGGVYSGFDANPDEEYRGGVVPISLPSRDLRGTLATDPDGIAEFDTIYPGFYAGRAIHLHFKVHVGNQIYVTSQALFPEQMNARVLAMPLYDGPRGTKRLLNSEDPDFIGDIGEFLLNERAGTMLATINLTLT